MKLQVRHYWAKTVNQHYGSEYQQLAIEITVLAILAPIIIYCSQQEGLGLFVIGLFFPTVMFLLSAIMTAYGLVRSRMESKKTKSNSESGNA